MKLLSSFERRKNTLKGFMCNENVIYPFERDERFKIKSENEQFRAFVMVHIHTHTHTGNGVTKCDRKWILVRMMVRFGLAQYCIKSHRIEGFCLIRCCSPLYRSNAFICSFELFFFFIQIPKELKINVALDFLSLHRTNCNKKHPKYI